MRRGAGVPQGRQKRAQERAAPAIIDGSRRRRIARGSGTSVQEVNRLLRQFADARKMLRQIEGMGRRKGTLPLPFQP